MQASVPGDVGTVQLAAQANGAWALQKGTVSNEETSDDLRRAPGYDRGGVLVELALSRYQ